MEQRELIVKAVVALGSKVALANAIGVKPPTIHQWICGDRPVPAKQCPRIELATNGAVTKEQLRPDIFGEPQAQTPDSNAA